MRGGGSSYVKKQTSADCAPGIALAPKIHFAIADSIQRDCALVVIDEALIVLDASVLWSMWTLQDAILPKVAN